MDANSNRSAASEPLHCTRCATELQPGAGDFYRVTIEAVADPWPPTVPEGLMAEDIRQRIESLLSQVAKLSEQEAMDQVYRRLTLYLCGSCYRAWIANPIGAPAGKPPESYCA